MFVLSARFLKHAPRVSLTATTRLRMISTGDQPAQPFPTDRRPIVISGPSGSGKSSLLEKLFREYPSTFGFSVSHTTRGPRPGELDGVAYHFVSEATMRKLIDQDRFLEHAAFSGNLYGTSRRTVQDIVESGKVCILDIELQGVRQVRESGLGARYVLVRPDSLETLEQRLRARGTETEEAIQKRLATARAEWAYGSDATNFDHVVLNDQLERAYEDLRDYIFERPHL